MAQLSTGTILLIGFHQEKLALLHDIARDSPLEELEFCPLARPIKYVPTEICILKSDHFGLCPQLGQTERHS